MKLVLAILLLIAAGGAGWWGWGQWQQVQGFMAEEQVLRGTLCTVRVVQLDGGQEAAGREQAVAWLERMAAHWLGVKDVASRDLPLMETFKREFKAACINSLRLDAYDAFIRMPEAMRRKGAV
ncbi:MAG: hypothetical protein EBQ80_03255 [Proteobacteria bacterium]|nr:hypothetical protein [Pseudomonadota bacterium]